MGEVGGGSHSYNDLDWAFFHVLAVLNNMKFYFFISIITRKCRNLIFIFIMAGEKT